MSDPEDGSEIFPLSDTQTAQVWCTGDECLAPWSGDSSCYKAVIKKLNLHSDGKFYASVKFCQYSSDDNEEIPITSLQKIHSPKQNKASKQKKIRNSANDDGVSSSLFKPLTGNENKRSLIEGFDDADPCEEHLEKLLQRNAKSTGKGKISLWKINTKHDKKTSTKKNRKSVTGRTATKQDIKESTHGSIVHECQEPCTSTGIATTSRVISENHAENKPSEDTEKKDVISNDDPSQAWDAIFSSSSNISPRHNPNKEETKSAKEGFSDSDMEKPHFSFPASTAKVTFQLSEAGETPTVEVPATINQYLRDYQREGIAFLYSHYKHEQGAILGDDMGLGKTVEVIGLLAALLHKKGNRIDVMKQKPKFIRMLSQNSDWHEDEEEQKVFLIIGPGSVLYNWLEELDTWGYFRARKYHGKDKESCLADIKKNKVEIVVTTFETFRDNVRELNSIDWDAVIVDEVHRIKGLKAQTTQALRTLVTKKRFGLTGTILQNNMTELWSILDWARPGVLGSFDSFVTEFAHPIEKGQKHDATKRELAEARRKKEKFASLRSKLMLRRTKKIISDQLPEKEDNIVFCKLSALQVSVYKAILAHPDMKTVLQMNEPCKCESGKARNQCCYKKGRDGTMPAALSLSFMHLLLKVANHVALLIPTSKMAENQVLRSSEICEIAFKDHPQFVNLTREASFRTLSDPKYCGKMKVLQGLLSVFQKSHSKVLIFSYSTRLLDILEQYIIGSGHEYRRIDGSVNNRKRLDIVREFNKDPNIFICLISTKAGGLGLNLTGANKVVIFDPNWNPSHDLQAQDRAYRIGQRNNVQVFRLISVGTIEENVYLRQVYKQQLDSVAVATEDAKRLFHGVQGDKMELGELFGIKNMFKLRTGESCLTMDVLQRNANIEAELGGYDVAKYIPVSEKIDNDSSEVESDVESSEEESVTKEISHSPTFFDSDDSGVDELDGNGLSKSSGHEKPSLFSKINSHKANSAVGISCKNRKQKYFSKVKNPISQKNVTITKKKLEYETEDSDSVPVLDHSPPQSFTSVHSVFEMCGVLHVHDNDQMVGSSRAEEHMSRKALQEVYELHQNSQVPAMQVDPYSETSDEDTRRTKMSSKRQSRRKKKEQDHNTAQAVEHESTRILIGQTPTAIRRQHFKKLVEIMKYDSPLALAESVLSSDTKKKLEMLNALYTEQHPDLTQVINRVTTIKHETESYTGKCRKTGHPNSLISQSKNDKASKKKADSQLTFVDVSDNKILKADLSKDLINDQDTKSDMEIGIGTSSHIFKALHGKKETKRKPFTQLRSARILKEKKERVVNTKDEKIQNSSQEGKMKNQNTSVTRNKVQNLIEIEKKVRKIGVAEKKDKKYNLKEKIECNDSVTCNDPSKNISVSDSNPFHITDAGKELKATEDMNTSDLLADIGNCQQMNTFSKSETDSNVSSDKTAFSIIDNIFLNSSNIKKPPPSPSPKKKINEEKLSANDESGFLSDLLNNSTLVDDSIDCFGLKRKRHKTSMTDVKTTKETDLHDDDDFDNLFQSKSKNLFDKSQSRPKDQSQKIQSESLFS